jgi:argininosuccinate lyase
MLGSIGILTKEEVHQLEDGLNEIIYLHKKGKFTVNKEDEDCHTAIENFLVKKLGNVGKKIHTGRSRNDQVLTALRLYYKQELTTIQLLLKEVNTALAHINKTYGRIIWPGFTHMRKAMPSSVGLWTEAFQESLLDTQVLLTTIYQLVDQSPLGTGAGFDVPLKLNREMTAQELGFAQVQNNSLYVQNSRGKFESSILHGLTQIMYDVNRIVSDLILFSMPAFGFIVLPDELCTGSSIMPQKKNPDVLELLRGSYHVVLSYQFKVQSMMNNLISGYNRDIQLTKKPIMHGFDCVKQCLQILIIVLMSIEVDKHACQRAMTDELYATQKAYGLVEQGISFRDAYHTIAKEFNGT